jgi:CSLREA domain-containing protein
MFSSRRTRRKPRRLPQAERIVRAPTLEALEPRLLLSAPPAVEIWSYSWPWCQAAAWADYNNDGLLDFAVTGLDVSSTQSYETRLFDHQYFPAGGPPGGLDGHWFQLNATELSFESVWKGGLAWGDYDGDGDLDLVIAGDDDNDLGNDAVTEVYAASGAPTNPFVIDAAASSDLPGVEELQYGDEPAWGDYDNDGDLDILLSGEAAGAGGVGFTEIYRNDAGRFAAIGSGLAGSHWGTAQWVDFDNDGDLDVHVTGMPPQSKLYVNDGGSFSASHDIGPAVWASDCDWGDYDGDGDLDLLIAGFTDYELLGWPPGSAGTAPKTGLTRLYRNDTTTPGVPVFTSYQSIGPADLGWNQVHFVDWSCTGYPGIMLNDPISGFDGPTPTVGTKYYENNGGTFSDTGFDETYLSSAGIDIEWADYDNDNVLDFLYCVSGGGVTGTYVVHTASGTNAAPPAPTNLRATVNGSEVTFAWDTPATSDDHTPADGLNYNLRVGTTPGADDVLRANADLSTGQRRLPGLGNVQQNLSWTLDGLGGGETWYWSVQSVDTSFVGSAWASQATTETGGVSGMKYADVDGDGSKDTGEPGLEGWRIYVDLDQDGQLDPGEPYDDTDANGDYAISGVPAGTRRIAEVQQDGWTPTAPASGWQNVSVPAGGTAVAHFGNQPAAIDLVVSLDIDEDDGNYSANDLSLREALYLASIYPGDDVITFHSNLFGLPIEVSSELVVDSNVDIQGLDYEESWLEGDGSSRLLHVMPGVTASISNMGLIDGSTSGTTVADGGGAVYNEGDLTIEGIKLESNDAARYGGAICNVGTLSVSDSVFYGGSATEAGGGIYNAHGATATLTGVVVSSNGADYGGGLYNDGGTMTVTESTVRNNDATEKGGGIRNHDGGDLQLIRSTVSGNTAGDLGGGVANRVADATIVNSTISGNACDHDGGGIYTYGGTLGLLGVTVAENTADANDSGSYLGGAMRIFSSTVTVNNSIIANNHVGSAWPAPNDIFGTLSGGTYNLIGDVDSAGGLTDGVNGNLVGVDPKLGPLGNNGGPYYPLSEAKPYTHALLSDSPAIDAGSDALATAGGLTTDQRGYDRFVDYHPGGSAVDIGAYEAGEQLVVTTLDDEDNGTGDVSLREAIGQANATPGFDLITYAPGLSGWSLIERDRGQLVINTNMEIRGPGADLVWLWCDSDEIRAMIVYPNATAKISGLTLTEGRPLPGGPSFWSYGGALANLGTLELEDVAITNSESEYGGGIYNEGELTLVRCEVSLNDSAGYGGGGIANWGVQASLTIIDSELRHNDCDDYMEVGGAILNEAGTVVIRGSTLQNNHAYDGGAIYNYYGDVDVANSTLAANTATRNGGALATDGSTGSVYLTNATVTGNDAAGGGGGSGGGIYVNGSAPIVLFNTIVAENTRDDGSSHDDVSGSSFQPASQYNLIGWGDGSDFVDGVQANQVGGLGNPALDPMLTDLGDHGGLTPTRVPMPASSAIDRGRDPWAAWAGLTTDQRGLDRFVDYRGAGSFVVDLGATEAIPGDINADGVLNDEDMHALHDHYGEPEYDLDGDGDCDYEDMVFLVEDQSGMLMGDANRDDEVTDADYTVWADHYGQSGSFSEGDFNGDGVVSDADYTIWADNYGRTTGLVSVATSQDQIPAEPLNAARPTNANAASRMRVMSQPKRDGSILGPLGLDLWQPEQNAGRHLRLGGLSDDLLAGLEPRWQVAV